MLDASLSPFQEWQWILPVGREAWEECPKLWSPPSIAFPISLYYIISETQHDISERVLTEKVNILGGSSSLLSIFYSSKVINIFANCSVLVLIEWTSNKRLSQKKKKNKQYLLLEKESSWKITWTFRTYTPIFSFTHQYKTTNNPLFLP